MLILDLCSISFHALVVFGLGKNLLFKSIVGRCGAKQERQKFKKIVTGNGNRTYGESRDRDDRLRGTA